MKLIILRTNIKTSKMVSAIKSTLNSYPKILRWSIDIEDIDNVLRIESEINCEETEIVNLIRVNGFYCEELSN